MSATRACVAPQKPGRPTRSDDFGDLYRSLFDKSGMCIARLDSKLYVAEANADFFRAMHGTADDVCGHNFFDFVHPGVRDKLSRQFAKLTEGRHPRFVDRIVAVRPGGTVLSGELTGIAVPDETGELTAVIVVVAPDVSAHSTQMLTGRGKKLLTDMDARVLEGVAAGESTVRLATSLYLSRGGVEYHVNTLMRKLNVTNRPALVSKAYSMGMFVVGSWPPRVLPEFVK
jgi:PAS domain S-box-containing protein